MFGLSGSGILSYAVFVYLCFSICIFLFVRLTHGKVTNKNSKVKHISFSMSCFPVTGQTALIFEFLVTNRTPNKTQIGHE